MIVIFRFLIVLLLILLVTLFDIPFLMKRENKSATFTYILILILGIGITYIIMQDLPVASPAVYIEKAINLVFKR